MEIHRAAESGQVQRRPAGPVATEKGRPVTESRASSAAVLELDRARADRATRREADVEQGPRSSRPEEARADEGSTASPQIAAPVGLVAWRLDVPGGEFALLEWPSATTDVIANWRRLTRAERDVTGLLVAGLSNAEIARQRGSSPRTVANQVASIFEKLGVSSRLELQAAVATSGPRREQG
jgi:DNA-binding CsgD family transcriptional regulator